MNILTAQQRATITEFYNRIEDAEFMAGSLLADISPKALRNFQKQLAKHGINIDNEEPILFEDVTTSLFTSGKDGLLLTNAGMYECIDGELTMARFQDAKVMRFELDEDGNYIEEDDLETIYITLENGEITEFAGIASGQFDLIREVVKMVTNGITIEKRNENTGNQNPIQNEQPLDTVCPTCGAERLSADSVFCDFCGQNF